MKTGVQLIAEERERQISQEGFTPAIDTDSHRNGELARAGACYALDYCNPYHLGFAWPWDRSWWKPTPKDPVRQLVKAGALIAAEIDRLRRLKESEAYS